MDSIPQDLVFALKNISHPDHIKQCEEIINNFKQNNPSILVQYLNQLLLFPDSVLRGSASVIIRGCINPNTKEGGEIWNNLPPAVKETIKTTLIRAINVETESHIRHKIVSIVTSIGPDLLGKNEWGSLLPFIVESIKSPNEQLKEAGFMIIGSLASDILKTGVQVNPEIFKQLVQLGLSDPSLNVQVAALGTISSFIDIDNSYANAFKPLLPMMLKTIDSAMQSGTQEKQGRSGIVTLILIVEIKPAWIRDIFEPIYTTLKTYMESEMVEDETRHHCLEFFITVAEKRPSLLKKPQYLQPLVHLILKWISSIEDEDLTKWAEGGDLDEDQASDAAFGADSLDRLGAYLGKALFTVITPYLEELVKSKDWKQRHACVISISMLSDGCKPEFQKNLKSILLGLVIPLFTDQHPRVRNAAFGCAGQIASDLTTALHKFIPELVPPILLAMNDPVPRVQSTICILLSDFLEDASLQSVLPYKDNLLSTLFRLIQSNKLLVAQSALNAFSTVIECIGSEFKPLYKQSMEFLVQILTLPNTKENRSFRGRAIEAISLIGVAVGPEIFKDDCYKIMEFLSKQPKFETDDPQIDFTLRAYTRFCQCLKEAFVPLLPLAMTPILDAIKQDFTVETKPFSDGFVQDIIDDNTSRTLDNKALALYLLNVYISELKRHTFPYLPNIIEVLPGLMKFYYNEEVRSHAADLVPLVLRTIKDHFDHVDKTLTQKYVGEAFVVLFKPLLDSTKNDEEQIENIATKVKNIGECLEIMGPLPDEYLKEVTLTFKEIFTSYKCYEQIIEEERDEDDTEAEEGFEIETLNESFTDLAVSIGDFIMANKEKSIPYITELLPTIFDHIETSNDDIKSSMICILIDILSNCGQHAAGLYAHIIPILLSGCQSNNNAIKQTAANGLGVAAEFGADTFAQYLQQSLNLLNTIISDPKCRSAENLECTENAIAAVGKITQFLHNQIPNLVPNIIDIWLKFIPVTDSSEFPATLSSYLYFMEHFQSLIMGPNCQNIPIFLQLIIRGEQTKNLVTEEQKAKLSNILKTLHTRNLLAPHLGSITAQEDKAILESYLKL